MCFTKILDNSLKNVWYKSDKNVTKEYMNIANEDIHVYKILKDTLRYNIMVTPYLNMEIKFDKLYKSRIDLVIDNTCIKQLFQKEAFIIQTNIINALVIN